MRRVLSSSLGIAAALAGLTVAPAGAGSLTTGLISLLNEGAPFLACTVASVGTTKVRVNSVRIIDEDGHALTLDKGPCTFPRDIFPALGCVISTGDASTSGHYARCQVDLPGSGSTLRVHLSSCDVSGGRVESSDAR